MKYRSEMEVYRDGMLELAKFLQEKQEEFQNAAALSGDTAALVGYSLLHRVTKALTETPGDPRATLNTMLASIKKE